MKTKRMISLLLAVLLTLSVAVTPAFAASAGDLLPAAESADVEESNDVVSIRLTTSGELVYGSPFTLSVVTKPADTQYIGVVIGTKGEAKGYVTLVLSDKIRTLLKMIPLPRKMSATPDQQEEFDEVLAAFHGVDRAVKQGFAVYLIEQGKNCSLVRDGEIEAAQSSQGGELLCKLLRWQLPLFINSVHAVNGKKFFMDEGGHCVPKRIAEHGITACLHCESSFQNDGPRRKKTKKILPQRKFLSICK